MRENEYQMRLIDKLKRLFTGCIVLKNDANYLQGFPDLTILYNDRWAVLEVKADARAARQPNQMYYIDMVSEMSFGAFIHPGNEEEVLDALQLALKSRRSTRFP